MGEDGERLLSIDFKKAKLSEILGSPNGDESRKLRRTLYSALWEADGSKVRRLAPVDFIGRYMPVFFDYVIADKVHELQGDTAQGKALGTLAACAQRTLVLTGTLLGGYTEGTMMRRRLVSHLCRCRINGRRRAHRSNPLGGRADEEPPSRRKDNSPSLGDEGRRPVRARCWVNVVTRTESCRQRARGRSRCREQRCGAQ